jgi:tetratricopeptide (TPR) repeat protein
VPKVIDFGVAKATGPRLTEQSVYTEVGSIIGTLEYMSPEQAKLNNLDIDTRSDIYALGVILYELLTGAVPFSRKELEKAGLAEMLRVIKEAEPTKPSTKLSHSDTLPSIAANRHMEPHRLTALVRGELDWIVMKALEKDRGRRYETANGFAMDVQRYLVGEPVLAAPASQWYRLRKFVRRHRGAVVAAGLVLLTLACGIAGTTWGLLGAVKERDAKALALKAEKQARADETKARQQAFAALRSMTADVVERKFAQGTVLTDDDRAFLRGVIAQFDAFAAIKGDDADSRAVRAEGRRRIGLMRDRLGEFKEAEQVYDQALSILKPLAAEFPARPEFRRELAQTRNNRGNLLIKTGRLKEAEQDYDQALRILKQLVADFPARPEFRQQMAKGHHNRGNLLSITGRLKQAEQDYDKTLNIYEQLAADFPARPDFRQELAMSHNNRGQLLSHTGRLREAEQDYDVALRIQNQLAIEFPARPEFGQQLAGSHNNRGNLLKITGRLKEAEQDYDEALRIQNQLAADFPARPDFRQELVGSHNNRGYLLSDTGRLKEAEKDFEQALRIQKQLAADFPARSDFRQVLAVSHNNRGSLLSRTGRPKEAEQDYDQAVSIFKQLAADFPARPEFGQELAVSHTNLGAVLSRTVRLKEAEQEYDQALRIQKQLAADFPNQPDLRNDIAGTCVNLALLHQQRGDFASSKRLLLEGQPHHLAALNANPRNPTHRQYYHNHLSALTSVHAGLLEQEDAVRTAEARRDLGWDAPADAYNAACLLSLCIPIVAKHAKLDEKQRHEAAQFYADAAMKLLRAAVSKGFEDAAHMKKDTDLDPLHPREDFQKLIAELEANKD